MLALLWPLLAHRSINGAWLGRFSTSYVAIIGVYLLALAATAVVVFLPDRRARAVSDSLRAPGLIFFALMYAAVGSIPLAVYLACGDRDYRHLSFLMLGAGVTALWGLSAIGPRARRPINLLALAVGALLVGFFLAELLLRVFVPGGKAMLAYRRDKANTLRYQAITIIGEASPRSVLAPDPVLGYRQQPGRALPADTMPYYVLGGEPRTDDWGFFNPGVDLARPHDAVVIGDSFVAAGWPNMMDAVNLGVPGYSPPQYTEVLRRWGLRARPRTVFYCLFANDAAEAEYWERWRASGLDWFTFKWMNYGAGEQHLGRIVLDRWLLQGSMIYSTVDWLRFGYSRAGRAAQAQPLRWKDAAGELVFDRAAFTTVTAMDNPAVERGFALIERNIAEAKRLCAGAGARLVLVILPVKEWAYFDGLKSVAAPTDPIQNLPRFYARLSAVCARSGVECHDLTPVFREAIARGEGPLYLSRDIHWSLAGNRLAASTVSKW
ncbi:MAG: hypothetical protein ABFD69_03555 [Candidatus Sumerlaeia bacterium]